MYETATDTHTLANNPAICDLRSDTVTRPCPAMRDAMANAPVGDDVYGDDPTVNELETHAARLLGKEAAIFMASGTQSNLAAMLVHCQRGDEIVTGRGYHVLASEGVGASVLGGIAFHALDPDTEGALAPADVAAAIKTPDPHYPVTRLLCIENTFGGRAIPLAKTRAASGAARDAGLAVHLDGARIFNAASELECAPKAIAAEADTVSVCLSKGLGAPAGTVLTGPHDTIARARRWRKMLGGGMRQSGILAAAGLYALQNNIERLGEDHDRAATFAERLEQTGIPGDTLRRSTNMIFFTPINAHTDSLKAAMREEGVLFGGRGDTIRLVFHKDIDDAKFDRAAEAIAKYAG